MLTIDDNELVNKNFIELIDSFSDSLHKEEFIYDKNSFIKNATEDLCSILKESSKKSSSADLNNIAAQYFSSLLESVNLVSKVYCEFEDTKEIESIRSYSGVVKVVTFSDGEKVFLYRKNSEVLSIFNKVVKWINEKLQKEKRLYIQDFIESEGYIFSEFIEDEPFKNELQAGRFYFKLGELLAIIYILNLRNVNLEGVLIKGDSPVVVDFSDINIIEPRRAFFCDDIAKNILDGSIYKQELLAFNKLEFKEEYIEYIKEGFQIVYNIALEEKLNLTRLISTNLGKDSSIAAYVLIKIQMLNNQDIKRQLNFIDARFSRKHIYNNGVCFSKNELKTELNSEHLLTVALMLGDYIIEKGIIGYKDSRIERTWIDTLEDNTVAIIGSNLYEGNNGIALFLAYLGVASKKEYFKNSAFEAMEVVKRYIENANKNIDLPLGAFKGISGMFYTLAKLYKLTGREDIKEFIKDNISILYRLVGNKCVNVMDGSAGVIAILTCIYNDIEDEELKKTSLDLINIAYKNVVQQVKILDSKDVFNVGFAYGLSGIIAYLSKLMPMKSHEGLEEFIAYILSLERKLYEKEKNRLKNNWLSGLSGILLSRLMLKDAGYKDPLLDKEIEFFVNMVIEKGLGDNPYYGYGQIGNLEILNYAAKVSKNPILKNRCINTYNNIIESILDGTMYENIDYDKESLSFINGLAGIGYSLIQKYDENLVPQILFFS